jgi:hypothetical protein
MGSFAWSFDGAMSAAGLSCAAAVELPLGVNRGKNTLYTRVRVAENRLDEHGEKGDAMVASKPLSRACLSISRPLSKLYLMTLGGFALLSLQAYGNAFILMLAISPRQSHAIKPEGKTKQTNISSSNDITNTYNCNSDPCRLAPAWKKFAFNGVTLYQATG